MGMISSDKVFITEDLQARESKRADYYRQSQAFRELASLLAQDAPALLDRFVNLAMDITRGASAGLSIIDDAADPPCFVWQCLRGTLSAFEGTTTPRDDSPCGVTLDRNRPTVAVHPERAYAWIASAGLVVPEVLLVPLRIGSDEPLGTLWVLGDSVGHFDSEDARILSELADFISMALQTYESRDCLKSALKEQEILAREMDHRLKNLFAMSSGMIKVSARSAHSAQELASLLSGRFTALARAHELVRRKVSHARASEAKFDLAELIGTIVASHESVDHRERIHLAGPAIACGERAVTNVALIFHELATNAAKYGALSVPDGRVDLTWHVEGDALHLVWAEAGGPPVTAVPDHKGFGTNLIDRTVISHFQGAIDRGWRAQGLHVSITMSLEQLAG